MAQGAPGLKGLYAIKRGISCPNDSHSGLSDIASGHRRQISRRTEGFKGLEYSRQSLVSIRLHVHQKLKWCSRGCIKDATERYEPNSVVKIKNMTYFGVVWFTVNTVCGFCMLSRESSGLT